MSTAAPRASLVQHALLLEYGTVGWNIIGGVVAIAAALSSGSIALLGFGGAIRESGALFRISDSSSGETRSSESLRRTESIPRAGGP